MDELKPTVEVPVEATGNYQSLKALALKGGLSLAELFQYLETIYQNEAQRLEQTVVRVEMGPLVAVQYIRTIRQAKQDARTCRSVYETYFGDPFRETPGGLAIAPETYQLT